MDTPKPLFRRDYGSARIGVFGCACWFYWQQFPGLRERLGGHQTQFVVCTRVPSARHP